MCKQEKCDINKVEELNSFFIGKLQAVQSKMKLIVEGVANYIPSILNEDGTLKDWVSWSDSFDNILSHLRFLVYCNNETYIGIEIWQEDKRKRLHRLFGIMEE